MSVSSGSSRRNDGARRNSDHMNEAHEAQSPLLEMEGIEKSFPGVRALKNGRLTLHRGEVLALLKRSFASVKHIKPAASRAGSSETYVLATGFKGRPQASD